jgi:hypothetical protein
VGILAWIETNLRLLIERELIRSSRAGGIEEPWSSTGAILIIVTQVILVRLKVTAEACLPGLKLQSLLLQSFFLMGILMTPQCL